MANRPRDVDWRFVQISALSTVAWLGLVWFGSVQHFTAQQKGVIIHGSPPKGVRAPYCATAANWLHTSHSLAGRRPDHSEHLRPSECTGSIHSPAADRTFLHFSGQLHAQAAFTRQPHHSTYLRQPATQAYTRLQLNGLHRWSETSSWQLNHGFLSQNSTLLYD